MIKIERYSNSGFEPQNQSYHLNILNKYLINDEDYISLFNDMANLGEEDRNLLLEIKHQKETFIRSNYEDFKRGIWCFISGVKNDLELNHIAGDIPNCHFAYLPEDTIVYDCNLEKKLRLSDFECSIQGVYIPEKSLKDLVIN